MSTPKNVFLGMVYVALGQLFLVGLDTFRKLLLSMHTIGITQIVFVRYCVPMCLALIWWHCKQPEDTVHWYGDSPYILNVWTRSFCFVQMSILLDSSLSLLPLGDALCIFFHAPLIVAILAYCVLGEKLPNLFVFLSACLLASSGIILLSQPTFITGSTGEPLNVLGVIYAFLAVAAYSIACLLVRMAKKAHVVQLEIVNSVQAVFVWIPLWSAINQFAVKNETMGTIFTSDWPLESTVILLLIGTGIFGFCGVLFLTLGYQYGEATKVAFLEYVEIPLLFVVQAIVFNDTPNTYEILGSVMVTVGCLLPVCEQYYQYKRSTAVQYEQVQQLSETDVEEVL